MDLVLSSKLFTWNKTETGGMFTAEASELEKALSDGSRHRLQYREGGWGFFMESHRTGRKLWFKLVKEYRSSQREWTGPQVLQLGILGCKVHPQDLPWFKLVKEYRSSQRRIGDRLRQHEWTGPQVLWVDFASKDPELHLRVFNDIGSAT